MRPLILAFVLVATDARAASLSLTEPPVPADYLEISLAWEAGEPDHVIAWAYLPSPDAILITDSFWYPLSGPDTPCPSPNHSCSFGDENGVINPDDYGKVMVAYGPLHINVGRMLLDFAPEIIAELAGVTATIGPLTGTTREITVTGPGAYERVYDVGDAGEVPEPATWLLGVCALMVRRRAA